MIQYGSDPDTITMNIAVREDTTFVKITLALGHK